MIAALIVAVAAAGLSVEPAPVAGAEGWVRLVDADGRPAVGVSVRAIHRPGLAEERQEALGLTDSLGRVRWSPVRGGEARILAGEEALDLEVRYATPPTSALVHLGLLLGLGLSAAAVGLRSRS